jgi:hypothetical protein
MSEEVRVWTKTNEVEYPPQDKEVHLKCLASPSIC